jgi:hypothetical protein
MVYMNITMYRAFGTLVEKSVTSQVQYRERRDIMSSFNIGGITVTILTAPAAVVNYAALTNGSVLNLIRMVERGGVRDSGKVAAILNEAHKRGLVEMEPTKAPEPTLAILEEIPEEILPAGI